MIPDDFAKKALEKLNFEATGLNDREYFEALEWLKTNYRNYGKSNYKHGYEDGTRDAKTLLDKVELKFPEDENM